VNSFKDFTFLLLIQQNLTFSVSWWLLW